MLSRLALLFIVIPLLELVLLIQLGSRVGLWPTLGLVVGTGIAGAILARAEGLRAWIAFQREVAEGRLPGRTLLDGLAILVGGAFLLTPGLLTDLAGFALLLPPSRRWLQKRMRGWLDRRLASGQLRMQVWTPFGGGPGGAGGPGDLGGRGGPWSSGGGQGPPDDPDLDPEREIVQGDDRE